MSFPVAHGNFQTPVALTPSSSSSQLGLAYIIFRNSLFLPQLHFLPCDRFRPKLESFNPFDLCHSDVLERLAVSLHVFARRSYLPSQLNRIPTSDTRSMEPCTIVDCSSVDVDCGCVSRQDKGAGPMHVVVVVSTVVGPPLFLTFESLWDMWREECGVRVCVVWVCLGYLLNQHVFSLGE